MRQYQARWVALCLLSALVFGLLPSFARFAYADGASVHLVLLGRSVVGLLGLSLFQILRGKNVSINSATMRVSFVAGIAHVFAAVGILASIAFIDIALAMMIIFLYPFPIAVVAHLRGEARLGPVIIGLMVTAMVGLGLVLGTDFETINPLGIAFAIVGAIGATVMIIKMADTSHQIGALDANIMLTFWAVIVFLGAAIIGPVLGLLPPLGFPETMFGWAMIVGVGITFSGGYLMFFVAAMKIGPARASLLSISEPVMMILFAIVLLGEFVGPVKWLGIALVVGSLALSEMLRRDQPSAA